MNLFYAPHFTASSTTTSLSAEESAHATKVLRKKMGDILQITNGKGLMAQTVIGVSQGKEMQLKIETITQMPPMPYTLDLYVAPTKINDRYAWFLEKATEIGVSSITPIFCEQSERKVIKAPRYEKVLLSAMKQSLQAYLPVLKPAISTKALWEQPIKGKKFIAHCQTDQQKQGFNTQNLKNQHLAVLIGPEGDFSTSEIAKALAKGFAPVSFGNTRLRTETAALYATASVAAQHETYDR